MLSRQRRGRLTRAERQQLLPTLHALHKRTGWISPGALNYIAQRLTIPPADVYGVATFYALFSTEPQPQTVLDMCDDIACRVNGGEDLYERLGGANKNDHLGISRSPCLSSWSLTTTT